MTLTFPNACRSFESRHDRVRFWGYDSTIEITFFLEATALRNLCPDMRADETGILGAFDTLVARIHAAATRAYQSSRDRSCTFVLTASAF